MTFDLAVNGPALFKEAWVNENDWPDFVFMPGYKPMSIEAFGTYIMTQHHLPDLPSAARLGGSVPLGKTQADLTEQVEEMALYIVKVNSDNKELKSDVQELTTDVKALKAEIESLKRGKEK